MNVVDDSEGLNDTGSSLDDKLYVIAEFF